MTAIARTLHIPSSKMTPTPSPSNYSPSSKASIDFIVSPSDGEPRSATTSVGEPLSSISEGSMSHIRSRLESLPRHLLGIIAYHVVVDSHGVGRSPSVLLPLFLTSKSMYNALAFDRHPELYNNLFRATFDHAALTRRYKFMVKHLSEVAGRGRKVYDLFSDPKSWAFEYKDRWAMSRRMREAVHVGTMNIAGLPTQKEIDADMWRLWFLSTENDGKNIRWMVEYCELQHWLNIHYRDLVLPDSLLPGYPKETVAKALGVWFAMLADSENSSEANENQIDEKIFVLRPFVFACARYDMFLAPWHHRRLPLCPPGCTEHDDESLGLMNRPRGVPYERFGQTWSRCLPPLSIGCSLYFLRFMDRHSERMGVKSTSSTFNLASGEDQPFPGLFSTRRLMPSLYHDREWQRDTLCRDPHTSPGLPPLVFRGEVQGFWRGKLLFYDFDMYRQILAGNMRGVYTGTFADRAGEWEFKETIIKVRKEDVGGKGPLFCSGFDDLGIEHNDSEQKRIQAGYGNEVVTDFDEPDAEGWTKEILISGRMRTSWGWGSLRGRVRSWDGLILITMFFPHHKMCRWMLRGYIQTGGVLVGRWRDTFTPENLRGYEGTFGMIRAGDIFYPPHFPKSMEESTGVIGPSDPVVTVSASPLTNSVRVAEPPPPTLSTSKPSPDLTLSPTSATAKDRPGSVRLPPISTISPRSSTRPPATAPPLTSWYPRNDPREVLNRFSLKGLRDGSRSPTPGILPVAIEHRRPSLPEIDTFALFDRTRQSNVRQSSEPRGSRSLSVRENEMRDERPGGEKRRKGGEGDDTPAQ